jgi:transposase
MRKRIGGFELARSSRRQGAILIQDNASCHKDGEVWARFAENRHWPEVQQLPPYSPELNPTERLWGCTRRNGTRDRYFPDLAELEGTLARVFGEIQSFPELIRVLSASVHDSGRCMLVS